MAGDAGRINLTFRPRHGTAAEQGAKKGPDRLPLCALGMQVKPDALNLSVSSVPRYDAPCPALPIGL
jgi:hypothetical protein